VKTDFHWQRYIKIALLIIGLIFVFMLRIELGKALIPFFLALIIASIIEPLIVFFQSKLHFNRTLASGLSLIFAVAIITALLAIVLVYGVNQIFSFASQLPKNQQKIATDISNLLKKLKEFYPKLPHESLGYLESILSNVFVSLQSIVTKTLNVILTWAASVPTLLIVILITLLATYFISKDRFHIANAILHFLPLNWQKNFKIAATKAIREIIGFIKGQIFLSLLTLLLSMIFLGFFLKSPYWMILAVILAILDMIPVLGPGLILLPWGIIALFMGYIRATWVTLVLYVVIIVTRQGLQPKVLGSYTGIHPLLMLFSIYAGLMIFGVWGLFLGPIILIILRAFIGFLKTIPKNQ